MERSSADNLQIEQCINTIFENQNMQDRNFSCHEFVQRIVGQYKIYYKFCRHIAVLGAGLMGAGVVQVSIDKGYHVTMKDMSLQGLARGEEQVYAGLNKQAKRKKITTYV